MSICTIDVTNLVHTHLHSTWVGFAA